MLPTLKTNLVGMLPLKDQLRVLAMPAALRRRLLKRMSGLVKKYSRARVRQQRDLNGQAWAPRKDKSNRRKMLRGLARLMTDFATPDRGIVTYKRNKTGGIARAHQEGATETFTAKEAVKRYGEPDYDAPATAKQARALREEDYMIRRKRGKGYKRATLKWVKENLTVGQAGVILRSMRDKATKESWNIELPSRSFLGVSPNDVRELVNGFYQQVRTQLKR